MSRKAPWHKIEEGLYVGKWVRVPPPEVQAVLNLCERRNQYRLEANFHEPIKDVGDPPSLIWLERMVSLIAEQRDQGRTVYVHCMAGVSRSGLVAAAWLMREHNWTRKEAMELLRAQRPKINPRPAFRELLKKWEQLLSQSETEP